MLKSANVTGCKNPMFGKIGVNKGKSLSEEIKRKISKSKIGKPGLSGKKNPMFGKIARNKGIPQKQEVKDFISKKAQEKWKSISSEEKEIKLKQLKKIRDNFLKTKKETKPEKEIRNMLEKNNIEFEPQKEIGYYLCDFAIKNKIIIEVQGD